MDASTKSTPPALPPDEDLTEVRKPASLLIAQFFLFPLIIIGICVGIFLLFGYMTYRQGTIAEYLDDVRFGAGTQRWQAAFELSNAVKSNPKRAQSPEFLDKLITAYKASPDEDISVRHYLAFVFGELKARPAVPLLVEELSRSESLKTADWSQKSWATFLRPSLAQIAEDLTKQQISTLYALGSIGDNSAVPGVLEQTKNQDPSIRTLAAYVLGVLGDPKAIGGLRPLLNDPQEDVRINTAAALAMLGDSEGAALLMKLLDAGYVDSLQDFTAEQKTAMRVNAVRALAKLKYEPSQERIRALSKGDPVPAVQGAALEALKTF
jgi:HEAT repeat protein